MRKIFFGFLALGFFLVAGSVSAQMGMMGYYGPYGSTAPTPAQSSEINGALQEIYKTQGIDVQAKVDCSKVTDDQFDKLGDAYMGAMLPNQQQHEVMDNMMGGEDSASLRQAHITMGRSYLGCWSNYNSGPIYMPMAGGSGWNMMNTNYGYPAPWAGYGTGGMLFTAVVWVLAIIGLIAIAKWLIEQKKKK